METSSPEFHELGLSSIPIQSSWQSATWKTAKRGHPWPDALFPYKPPKNLQSPTKSFKLFSMLPTELRLNVWRFAIFPRAVDIVVDETVKIAEPRCSFTHFRTRTQLPATFLVCRESREVVLPQYKLCFGSASYPNQAPSIIYFNPDVDTLYFGFNNGSASREAVVNFIQHAFDELCCHARLEIEFVKRIAVSHRILDRVPDFAGLLAHLTRLPSIEEFIVLIERQEVPYKGQIVLEEPDYDSDIASLHDWIEAQFGKNQFITMPAYFERSLHRPSGFKIMEAKYESMYSPPVRPLKPIGKGGNGGSTAEVSRLHLEVDEHDWFDSVTEILDGISLN
jgi:hypothetical protein